MCSPLLLYLFINPCTPTCSLAFSLDFLKSYLSFRTYSRRVSRQGATGPFHLPCMSSPQTSLKKVFFWSRKKVFSAATSDVSHQFATHLLYIQHESNQTIVKIGYMVKVFTNTNTTTRIESQPAPARTRKEKKEGDLVCLKAL